jgi:hypothetical protein
MNEKFYIEAKVQKIDKDIKSAIKKAGIQYPHPALAFFKATYAKLEEANGNGVILANSVVDDIPYLIGCQMNKNHYRYGNIMGEIIDAYLTDNNEIEIIFSFHKSVYESEYEEALHLMNEGKLTVSFELKVDKANIEITENGSRKLSKVDFEGVGLLFAVKPAYRNAYVLETAMKAIEGFFNNEDKQLVYANVQDIAQKWTRIGQLIEESINQNGGNKMEDIKIEEVIAEKKEVAVETVEEKKEEVAVEKVEEKKEEVAVEIVEEKKEEVAVEKVKEAKVVVETKIVETNLPNPDESKSTEIIEKEVVVKVDDVEVQTEKVRVERTYSFAELEEIKAEYEKKLAEKDAEILFIKENAQKVIEIRKEMGEFVAHLSDMELFDEAKMEIAKLKKENADLKVLATAEEKVEPVVEEKKEELTTGHDEVVVDTKVVKEQALKELIKYRYGKN